MLRPIGKVSEPGNILDGHLFIVRKPANQVSTGIFLRTSFIAIKSELLFSTKGNRKYTGDYTRKESMESFYPRECGEQEKVPFNNA